MEVEVVRVYLTEHESVLREVIDCLHDECGVRGTTVFRGISGFGASGKLHESRWTDLSLDLPIVVEFFDDPSRAAAAREALSGIVPSEHVVYWPACTQASSNE